MVSERISDDRGLGAGKGGLSDHNRVLLWSEVLTGAVGLVAEEGEVRDGSWVVGGNRGREDLCLVSRSFL